MSFFLYRFLDIEGKVIYIGRTNNINRRILKEHFTNNTHLPNKCYLETEKVEYTEVINESEEVAYEAILINKYRPKFNTQFKDDGDFKVELPEFQWNEFEWEYNGQLEWLKKNKQGSINADDIILNCLGREKYQNIFGIKDIDSKMILLNQSFTLIAGISGTRKTDYLLNIAKNNAKLGNKVLFINLKNSIKNLSMRILSINTKIPLKDILLNQFTKEDMDIIYENLSTNYYNNISFYNHNENFMELNKILEEMRNSYADLIIIDDLEMIENERNYFAKDKMEYVLKSIKSVGIQLSIPVIGAYSIQNNKPNSRFDHRPVLSDIEYGSLISYPDNIQLLYCDDMYDENSIYKNIEEIIIVKNMIGELFTVNVTVANNIFANLLKNKMYNNR